MINKKLLKETMTVERARAILILKDLVKQKQAYASELDEVSRLNDLIKQFENKINTKEDQ